MEQNEKVAEFMSATGVDATQARHFLEAAGWKLNDAINLMFDGGGVAATSSAAASSSAEQVAKQHGVDMETARAIAAAQESDGDAAVRAPIAPTVGRLFDEGFGGFGNPEETSRSAGVVRFRNFETEARQLEAKRRMEAAKKGIGTSAEIYGSASKNASANDEDYGFEYEDDDGNDDAEEEDQGMASGEAVSSRDRNLQSLFSPPRELLFQGTFEQAREEGKREGRWILANIQKDSEFFSYVLNRDLWQSDVIQDVLRSRFVFFQHEASDQEASRYTRLYKVDTFPHVAILDPRTGQLVLPLSLRTRANESDPNDLRSSFLDKVSHFLEVHPMSRGLATPPVDSRAPPKQPRTSAPTPSSNVSATPPPQRDNGKDQQLGSGIVESTKGSKAPVSYATLEEEPDAGAEGTGPIRIRLFDGKTVNRRFRGSSKVSQLFSYVNTLVPETRSRGFDILCAGQSIKEKQESTIQDMKLLRSAMTVKWLS